MTPTLLSQRTPLSPVSAAIPRVDSGLRLGLHPVPARRAVVDRLWWPSSSGAAAELPGLIAAVDRRLGRVTLRVGVHREAWRRVPLRIPVRGREVRVGCFGHADPRMIVLFFAVGEPVASPVIPPGTAAGPAEATFKLTARNTAGSTVDAVFTLTHLPSVPAPRAKAAGSSAYGGEREGAGHRAGGAVLHRIAVSAGVIHVPRAGRSGSGTAHSGGGPISIRRHFIPFRLR